MKIILTSCFCDFKLVDGHEAASALISRNGLLDAFKSVWVNAARVLIICSDPDDYSGNDELCERMRASFLLSGLDVKNIEICDNRRLDLAEQLNSFDVLVFAGGHVPTQNRFMKKIALKERLRSYNGSIVALSAGSMNCAETVYAIPELDGEATDTAYERWISGLGLTDINIFPHYQYLRGAYVDGLRMAEDIAFRDSIGKEIIALNDGSYIFISDGKAAVYGEAYMIKDGKQQPLCQDGESCVLKTKSSK